MDLRKIATLEAGRITIDPSLRLYVPFNEGIGDVAKDYSQYGNNGVLTDVEWGIRGGVFNGTSAYVNCGSDPSLSITDAITIEAWVKPDSVTGVNEIVNDRGSTGSGTNFEFRIRGGALNLYWYNTVWRGWSSANNVCVTDKWQHVASTNTTGDPILYVNGVEKAGYWQHGDDAPMLANSNPVIIGVQVPDTAFFCGSIGDVRIYSRVLSAFEIKTMYENEQGKYEV